MTNWIFIVKTVHACPKFETLIGDFEVEKWNFELKLRNSKLKPQKKMWNLPRDLWEIFTLCLLFKFGVISWFTKQITKSAKKKLQGRFEKFYEVPGWSFEVSIQSFILNFEVSDHSFEVRGEARLNRFYYKHFYLDGFSVSILY